MSDYPYHQRLQLENFTVFRDATLEFVPGVNAFVGENGTGKTHVLKALYAAQLTYSRQMQQSQSISQTLMGVFQTKELFELIHLGTAVNVLAVLSGTYGGQAWKWAAQRGSMSEVPAWVASETPFTKLERPVFIPAIDMMGHTRGFLQAANEVVLDFDSTCIDLVILLGLERKNGSRHKEVVEGLSAVLGGELEYQESNGRFYLVTPAGRLPMPLVAEGLRKIATLVRLAQNGWLTPGTTFFWDEPEVNLNPKLMDEVVGAILALARAGIQVFIATHSYVILKELDLQAGKEDNVRYFGFQKSEEGTTVNHTDDFALLEPNPILEQYDRLYDLELTRATGRNKSEPACS